MKHVLGFLIGIVMLITPEPVSSALGLGIVTYISYKNGWLGHG